MSAIDITVRITERHIQMGIWGLGTECPIALACNESYPGGWLAERTHLVSPTDWVWRPKTQDDKDAHERFISLFDGGFEVGPTTITYTRED